MMRSLLALLACLAALPQLAHADMTCSYTTADGDAVTATFTQSNGGVASRLLVNGEEMPAIRACVAFAPRHGNPRMGTTVRCPHGAGAKRFEVYPVFPNNEWNRPAGMYVIRWNGDQVAQNEKSNNCQ